MVSCWMGLGLLALLGGGGRRVLFVCAFLCLVVGLAAGNVVLIGKNVSLSFDDIEASFAPAIKGSGECGVLYTAEPLDACTPLTNKIVEGPYSPFILIIRGGCTFEDKIKSAQHAGFKAAIIYDNEDSGALVAMAGTSSGIHIHAVFVSQVSGDALKEYAGRRDVELWIIPSFENSAWSIMAISFISLLALSAVLATCFFVRRHRVRRERPRTANVREFHGMSSRLVRAMPSLIFTSVLEDNSTSRTCAICIEDYNVGERLRILPCSHRKHSNSVIGSCTSFGFSRPGFLAEFHASCVDAWLTSWRTFCPVCKHDARTSSGNPPASEFTPLLSPASSIAATSSFHSSVAASPSSAIPIRATPVQSPLTSRTHSLSSIPRVPNTRRSYNNSQAISIGGSSFDLRNASPNRSCTTHLLSPHSLGYPSSSPLNARYLSAYLPSPSNESPGYLAGSSGRQSFSRHVTMSSPSNVSPGYLAGSSGRQSFLRHFTESATDLSAQASAESLPGC